MDLTSLSQTYLTFTYPLLLLLLATAHYSPSSLDVIIQLYPASITEDSNMGKTHHVCLGFIRESMVISTPGWIPVIIFSPGTQYGSFQTICMTGKNAQSILRHPA